MSHRPIGRMRTKQTWGQVPLPAMVVLALFLAAGPVGLARSREDARATAPGNRLRDVARKAGCRLQEYENARVTNPRVSGPLVERAIATDGSYIGRATPTVNATTHSLLHGRVLIQYQPGLPEPQVRALDQLVKDDPDRVVRLREPDQNGDSGRRHRLPEPAHLPPSDRQYAARAPCLPRPTARIRQRLLTTGRNRRSSAARSGLGAESHSRGAGILPPPGR
jgi:hypothetical protein